MKTGGPAGFQLPITNYPITNFRFLDPSRRLTQPAIRDCQKIGQNGRVPDRLRLSSRPERHANLVPSRNLWRGVERSRGSIPCDAASGSSHENLALSINEEQRQARQCMGRTPCDSMTEDAASGSLHSAQYNPCGTQIPAALRSR